MRPSAGALGPAVASSNQVAANCSACASRWSRNSRVLVCFSEESNVGEGTEEDCGQAGLLGDAPQVGAIQARGLAQPLDRPADAQQAFDLQMDVRRFQLVQQHVARNRPVRGEKIQPGHDQPVKADARAQRREIRRVCRAQHRAVGAVVPGFDQVVLHGEMPMEFLQGDAQRFSDLVQVQPLPGRLPGKFNGGIDDSVGQ